jgi:DNA (cytosine-5)-methyltransferase 1
LNYYNEIDPYAAAWLRNLIAAGHITPGIVDERSIEDVHPSDIRGFTQCHFFAGIGVWSLALRRAGWPDDRPVWTGSCPCQPFSSAGKGAGFADERHLWPAFHWLIQECRPAVIYGEQVASSDVGPWLDLVQADVEDLGYAFGCVAFPSAGVGAPHIRDRLFWLAHAADIAGGPGVPPCGVADAQRDQQRQGRGAGGETAARNEPGAEPSGCGQARGLGHANCINENAQRGLCGGSNSLGGGVPANEPAGPTNGLWRAADWLLCRDGKWRPVEPGTFPLAHGAPARVGRLRAYGNAINAEAARVFIEATL